MCAFNRDADKAENEEGLKQYRHDKQLPSPGGEGGGQLEHLHSGLVCFQEPRAVP